MPATLCAFKLFLAAAATILSGCTATTSVSTVWKSSDPGPVHFEKVLAVVANASPAERRAGEDELVRSITSTTAVASYTIVSDEDLKDKDKVRAAIEGKGFDGAAVIRLVSTDKRTSYVPPQYNPIHDPLYGNFNYNYYDSRSPGYTTTDTFIACESSLYSVTDKKLIWAGSSTTEDPANIQDLVAQVARGVGKELRAQGLIK